jgi:hypothetical protein
MKRRYFVLIALVTAACMSELEPEVGPLMAGQCKNEDSNSEEDLSFKEEVLPMLAMRCGCHDPKMSGSAIDTTSFSIGNYREVMKGGVKSGENIVKPGDPCNSVLVQKCGDAPPFGSRMPVSGPYFSKTELSVLSDWIVEGAHDN